MTTGIMDMDENYNHLLFIFNSLNNSNNYDTYQTNLKWLEDYRKTDNAWFMSLEILKSNEENLDLKLFSSQTLRQKIIYELQYLKQDAIELKNSITYLLYINKDKSNPILTQLCLALSDLAILCDDWNNPIEEICELFEKNTEMTSILFQFLAYIPEELNNKQLKLSERKAKIKEEVLISNIVNNIVEILSYYSMEANNNSRLKSNINNCIYNWIRYKAIKPLKIIKSPLMNYIIKEAINDEIDEVIGSIINELIISSSTSSETNKELLNYITPTIFELSNHIKYISSKEVLLIYNLMFETYAEYNIYTIIKNYNDFKFIIASLIELYSIYPNSIEISYRFFTILQEQLNNIGYQNYKPQFVEAYSVLQEKTLNLYKLTSMNNDDEISLEVFEVMFQNCFLMLNEYDILNSLYESLKNELCNKTNQNEISEDTSNNIEVHLFYLYSIIFNINNDHQNIIREIVKMIPYFPNNEKINNVIIRIIGDLSEYSFNNNIEINEQLNYLISFLENESNRYQGFASLLEFTKYCGMYLTNLLDEFCNFYIKVINVYNYQDIYDLLKSICNILIYVSKNDLYYYLNKLNLPLIEKLQLLTSDEYINNPNNNINNIAYDIQDIISYISLFFTIKLNEEIDISENHPIIELYNNYHSILVRILDLCQNDENIVEEICNCYIEIMNNCTYHIYPTIENLLERIVLMHKNTKYNCYLWVFTQSIKLYMNESKEDIYYFLLDIFNKFTETVFSINSNEIMNYSHVLEEYFHLCNQIIIESPSYVFNDQSIISEILNFSVKCLDLNLNKVRYEIIDFYSELFNSRNVNMLSGVINYDIIKNVIKSTINLLIENIEEFLSTDLSNEISSLLLLIYDNSNEELLDIIKELLLDYSDLLSTEDIDDVIESFTKFV
ncbi:armadillo-type protein [Neocallimastix sp. 'constans']